MKRAQLRIIQTTVPQEGSVGRSAPVASRCLHAAQPFGMHLQGKKDDPVQQGVDRTDDVYLGRMKMSPQNSAHTDSSGPSGWRIGRLILVFAALVMAAPTAGQAQTVVNMFGHLEAVAESDNGTEHSGFSVGEHDFFVTSQLSDRIRFLSETVVNPQGGSGGFVASIERALLTFNYAGNHNVIVGKMHTPLNYWNDTYHHGRFLFPTIDRPESFSHVVPIHTLGLRLQGQNLGALKFGYDVVLGNGLSSNDKGDEDLQKSLTAAWHIKPFSGDWEGSRIGMGYYRDVIYDNHVGSHGGHGGSHRPVEVYSGDVDHQVASVSAWLANSKMEFLYEYSVSMNSYPDSAGAAESTSHLTYLYAGYKLPGETDVLYGLLDYVVIPMEELHLMPQQLSKYGLGWRHEFSSFVHSKFQLERYTGNRDDLMMPRPNKWEVKVQLAYRF